jgi:hypothetical protein
MLLVDVRRRSNIGSASDRAATRIPSIRVVDTPATLNVFANHRPEHVQDSSANWWLPVITRNHRARSGERSCEWMSAHDPHPRD